MALGRVVNRSVTRTNSPGHSAIVRVWESALQLDGAGGGIDALSTKVSTPDSVVGGVVLRSGVHRQLALRHVPLDVAQLRFGHREGHVDGLHFGDGHQVAGIGGDDVALLHGDVAGAAVDGRADGGVAQSAPWRCRRPLVTATIWARALSMAALSASTVCDSASALDAHLVGLLARDHALVEQLPRSGLAWSCAYFSLATSRARLACAWLSAAVSRARFACAWLSWACEGPRIDGEQQIALLDGVAFVEGDFGQLAAHLGLHRDGGVSLHVADDVDIDRNVFLRNRGHHTGTGPPSPPRPPPLEPPALVEEPALLHPWIVRKAATARARSAKLKPRAAPLGRVGMQKFIEKTRLTSRRANREDGKNSILPLDLASAPFRRLHVNPFYL